MIALLQRVKNSRVSIDGGEVARIAQGYTILLGVVKGDSSEDIAKLVKKILNLRLFPNEEGKMDKNILQIGGQILVVSQFTLAANCKRGNRPDFSLAMPPALAKELYEDFVVKLKEHIDVQTGVFGAMMDVQILNDGPVTIILDSHQL